MQCTNFWFGISSESFYEIDETYFCFSTRVKNIFILLIEESLIQANNFAKCERDAKFLVNLLKKT